MNKTFFETITTSKIIFYISWFLCFSVALPHHILPGKAGFLSILLFILWMFEGDLKVKIHILYKNKLFLSVFALILVLSISMLWSEHKNIGIARLSIFKYYIFIIPVLTTSITKKNALELIRAFVLGNILHGLLIILFSFKIIELPDNLTLYSPYSVYAPFFVFSSFYCFYCFRHKLNNKVILQSLIYLSCALIFAYLIFTHKGRSGQIAFLSSAILTLFLLHKSWRKTAIFFVITAALIVTMILSSQTVKTTYITAMNEIEQIKKDNYRGSWGARWGLLIVSYKIIKQNPLSGVGIGDTHSEMKRIIKQSKNPTLLPLAYYDVSHNHYITIMTSAGVLGLIMYLLIHIFIFKLPIKNTEIKYLSLVFLTILVVNSIADDILLYKPYNIYFAIMIALFINSSLDEKDIKYLSR